MDRAGQVADKAIPIPDQATQGLEVPAPEIQDRGAPAVLAAVARQEAVLVAVDQEAEVAVPAVDLEALAAVVPVVAQVAAAHKPL